MLHCPLPLGWKVGDPPCTPNRLSPVIPSGPQISFAALSWPVFECVWISTVSSELKACPRTGFCRSKPMPCCDALPLCEIALVFLLLFPIADSYTMYCQPSLLSLHLPISRFLLLVHLCLGLFFSQVLQHAVSQVASHDVIPLWTCVLFSLVRTPLGFWSNSPGWDHTNNQIISDQRVMYLFAIEPCVSIFYIYTS